MVAFTFANHFTSSRFAIPGIVHYHQWMALLCGDCFGKGGGVRGKEGYTIPGEAQMEWECQTRESNAQ